MAAGQDISKSDKGHIVFGAVVWLLSTSCMAGLLATNQNHNEPLVPQEISSAPVAQQNPAATPPAPVAVIPAPATATTKSVALAPQKQVVAKPQPVKTASVIAPTAPVKSKPVTKKTLTAASPQTVKSTLPKQPETGYRKLDAAGNVLPDDATEWACVQDRATGLIWEVKTNDNGIRDRDNFFSWYDPARERNFGNSGERDGGRCKGQADCDTLAYAEAINETRLCGFADWRLPIKDELLSLIEYNYGSKESNATINRKYFPHAVASWYWSASANPKHPEYAWYVLFRNGLALNAPKTQPKHVRLVRGNGSASVIANKSNSNPQYLASLTK